MAFLKIKNRAFSTLASGVDDTTTSWTLATGEGAKFPTAGDFHVTCEDEIVKCTSRSTDVLTVVRAQEGTSAAAHVSGKAVELRITAGVVENVQTELTNHNATVLSTTVHDNDNLFSGYGAETVATLPNNIVLRVPALTAVSDPGSMIDISDWYGASGAYLQADADSDATHIEDDSESFPDSIKNTMVKWASNAAGDADTGIGVITAVDSDTLTIAKCSGANFGASYYYWIKHSEITIPVTGQYLVTGSVLFLPAEADKHLQVRIVECNGTAAPTTLASADFTPSIADYIQPLGSWIIPLTATRTVYLAANVHSGVTTNTVTLYYSAASHNPLGIFLLKQTA